MSRAHRSTLVTLVLLALVGTAPDLRGQIISTSDARNWLVYQRASEGPDAPLHTDRDVCTFISLADRPGECHQTPGLSAEARAEPNFGGLLRARAQTAAAEVELTPRNPPSDLDFVGLLTSSRAGISDVILLGVGGAVVPATLRLRYRLEGTMTRTAADESDRLQTRVAMGLFAWQAGPVSSDPIATAQSEGATSEALNVLRTGFIDFHVVGQSRVLLYFDLETQALVGDAPGRSIDGLARSEFVATLGIQALDANGADVTEAARLRYSLAPYPVFPLELVPEPGTAALVATGGLALAALGARRRAGIGG